MIKFVKKIAAMALCLAIGISATAYASPETNNTTPKENINQYNKGVNEGNKGHDGDEKQGPHGGHHHKGKVLEKLGITKAELEEARKSGKSFFDIAKSKGHSESEVKKIMIEDRNNYIDQAVKDKKITKEKADQIKNIVNEKIKSWDGNLKENSNGGNSGNTLDKQGTTEENGTNNGTANEGSTEKGTTDGTTNKSDANSESKGNSENSSDNKSNIENGTTKDNNKSNISKDNTTNNKSKNTR